MRRTAPAGATYEQYRAMGFSKESAQELAATRNSAAMTAEDARSAHDNSQAHQTWSMRNLCPECERLRTGSDPLAPTNQTWLDSDTQDEPAA
jgi:hypothetical protein